MRKTPGRRKYDQRKRRESTKKRIGARLYKRIMARDGERCVYCGGEENLQLDHLLPRSKGGNDASDNLVVACKQCNSTRQNMNLTAWSRYLFVVRGVEFSPRKIRRRAKRNLL